MANNQQCCSDYNANVEEYYFDDYYRVVILRENGSYVVSVDVYSSDWIFKSFESICVENVCMLVKRLKDIPTEVNGVSEIIIIGVRVKDKLETINVKWVMDHKPSREELERVYRSSWQLITSATQS